MLRLNAARISPRKAAAMLKFRSAQRRPPPAGTPHGMKPIVAGNLAEVAISDVLPRTLCFVHVDLEVLAIRWTHESFISLHAVEHVEPVLKSSFAGQASSIAVFFATSKMHRLTSFLKTLASVPLQQASQRMTEMSARVIRLSGRLSKRAQGLPVPPSGLRIVYNDDGGVQQRMQLWMVEDMSCFWVESLPALLIQVPKLATPAHWRWALRCMAATNRRGATGHLRRSELGLLLRRSNASPRLVLKDVNEALRSFEKTEQQQNSPVWLRAPPTGHENCKQVNAQHGVGMLLSLGTSSKVIAALFDRLALNGKVGTADFTKFVSSGEIKVDDNEATAAGASLHAAHHEQTGALRRLSDSEGLDLLHLSLRLLSPQNDAVEPQVEPDRKDGFNLTAKLDLDQSLENYWAASSHNSYIVGDQLTGLSSAMVYCRQLLQVASRAHAQFRLWCLRAICHQAHPFARSRGAVVVCHARSIGLSSPRD